MASTGWSNDELITDIKMLTPLWQYSLILMPQWKSNFGLAKLNGCKFIVQLTRISGAGGVSIRLLEPTANMMETLRLNFKCDEIVANDKLIEKLTFGRRFRIFKINNIYMPDMPVVPTQP